jgi:hypothetical protein
VKELGLQGFVVLLLLMVTTMALIYGLKYQEDVRGGRRRTTMTTDGGV